VVAVALWDVAFMTEVQILRELEWIANEDSSLLRRGKVVEEVLVEHAVLDSVSAVDELLLHFPADGAHVAELTDRLFHVDTVVVKVLHNARSGGLEIEVSSKLKSCLNCLFEGLECQVFHVPAGLLAINANERVVVLVVEESSLGNRFGLLGETADQDSSIAVKVRLNSADGAVVNLVNWHVDLEDVVRNNSNQSHCNGLCACLGVSIEDPAAFTAVFQGNALLQHLDKSSVVDFITHDLGLSAKSIGENAFTLDKRLNNLLGSQVYHTSLAANDLSKVALATRGKADNGSRWSVCEVLRNRLASLCVLAGLGQEYLLLSLGAKEVDSLSVQDSEVLSLFGVEGCQR